VSIHKLLKIRYNQIKQLRLSRLLYLGTNDLDELNMTSLHFEYRLTVYKLHEL